MSGSKGAASYRHEVPGRFFHPFRKRRGRVCQEVLPGAIDAWRLPYMKTWSDEQKG